MSSDLTPSYAELLPAGQKVAKGQVLQSLGELSSAEMGKAMYVEPALGG